MMSGKDFVKATCILHLIIDVKAVNKTHNIKERKDKPEKTRTLLPFAWMSLETIGEFQAVGKS